MKSPFRYEVRLIFGELLAVALLTLVASFWYLNLFKDLNTEAFVQGLIAFNSGIIIALFVALFHSSDANIMAFKKFKLAASQIYKVLIVNSILVCLCALFTPSSDGPVVASMLPQLAGTLLAGICSAVNVYIIYRLLSVYFRD